MLIIGEQKGAEFSFTTLWLSPDFVVAGLWSFNSENKGPSKTHNLSRSGYRNEAHSGQRKQEFFLLGITLPEAVDRSPRKNDP